MTSSSRNQIPYYRFDSLPGKGYLDHGVFTRLGGFSQEPYKSLNLSVSVRDNEPTVMTNRAAAYGIYGRSTDSLVHAHLIHSAVVARVTHLDYGRYVGPVDALITDQPGCGLTMNYADCSPIVLYDPVHHAVGLGHSGWQGAVKDLPGAMVGAMTKQFGTRPDHLIAAIGPSIGSCCYEVGDKVISSIRQTFSEPDVFLLPSSNSNFQTNEQEHAYFNLPAANKEQLVLAGVEQIEMSDLCTACRTDLFFSHRAESGKTGRFGALIILK